MSMRDVDLLNNPVCSSQCGVVVQVAGRTPDSFSLLIGKDGKIAAVDPRAELLAAAIAKALADK